MSVGHKRRRGGDRYVRLHVSVPEHLLLRFDTLYTNRARGKLIYGSRSQMITSLLEEHVRHLEGKMAKLSADPYNNPEFLT